MCLNTGIFSEANVRFENTALLCRTRTHTDRQTTPQHTHLSKRSDSVLIGKEWRVIANLEVKVNRLVCEGGKFIAEAELVGAILSCCECKAVILLLHLLVESSPVWIFQTTVHIIMTTGDHLENYRNNYLVMLLHNGLFAFYIIMHYIR